MAVENIELTVEARQTGKHNSRALRRAEKVPAVVYGPKVKNVDVGVAYDMFRADVAAGQALPYNTATVLPTFDFAKAKKEWDTLTEKEQKEAYAEWHAFVETNYEKKLNTLHHLNTFQIYLKKIKCIF